MSAGNEQAPGQPVPYELVLQSVGYASELRHDGMAHTYFDPADQSLVLVPQSSFDAGVFEATVQRGLSIGRLARYGESNAVKYPATADLISLSSVVEASFSPDPSAGQDLVDAVTSVHRALRRYKGIMGILPAIDSVDGVAIGRTWGVIEFLPPYGVNDETTPTDVMDRLYTLALGMATDATELARLRSCFVQGRSGL